MPSEFWALTLREAKDVITARTNRKNAEIYGLSNYIRLAVLSVLSPDVMFPNPPQEEETNSEKWKNSYNYLKQIQKSQRGCKNK